MPSTTEFRKTITDPTPLYFAAGVIEKVRTEAPERIAKVRATDPKLVQERFQGALEALDADIKKLREQAQTFALQGVGYAAEAAVKAKEGYDSLAEQGKSAVEGWRGQPEGEADSSASDSNITYETTIEREPATPSVPKPASADSKTASSPSSASSAASEPKAAPKAAGESKANSTRKTTAKKTTPRKTAPKSSS